MRFLVIFTLGFIPAAAQNPQVQLVNVSRPHRSEVQVGDRYEVRISGAPHQPISVRTVRQGRIDWGPVVGSTDSTGRWSTAGQFEKGDFGGWSEIWTVGGKIAVPAIQFFVNAPCVPGGRDYAVVSGPNEILTCDATERGETFVTPSLSDPFRTPDGRVVPGRPNEETAEQHQMQILNDWIANAGPSAPAALYSSRGGLGDGVAVMLEKMIGPNALNEGEIRNVLSAIRAAFDKPETVPPDSRAPKRTVPFLRRLAEQAESENLRQRIADTIAFVQAR